MAKPTVADHRTEIRGYLQEIEAAQFTDAEINAALNDALAILSNYEPCERAVTVTGLTPASLSINVVDTCPASAVIAIYPTGGGVLLTFRVRDTWLLLDQALGDTSAILLYRDSWRHDGTNTDYYPQRWRGAVTMLAAGLCLNGYVREIAVTVSVNTNLPLKPETIQTAAAELIRNALLIMQGGKITQL